MRPRRVARRRISNDPVLTVYRGGCGYCRILKQETQSSTWTIPREATCQTMRLWQRNFSECNSLSCTAHQVPCNEPSYLRRAGQSVNYYIQAANLCWHLRRRRQRGKRKPLFRENGRYAHRNQLGINRRRHHHGTRHHDCRNHRRNLEYARHWRTVRFPLASRLNPIAVDCKQHPLRLWAIAEPTVDMASPWGSIR